MGENQDKERAMQWWRSLSYNEQDALIRQYVADSGYYYSLARAGKLSEIKILGMMKKEGAF
jgi:hypothetical protein